MIKKGQRTRLDAIPRKIETIFYNESQIRRAVQEARSSNGNHTGGNNGHAFVSDPTANEAVRNVTEIKDVTIDVIVRKSKQSTVVHYPERWLKVIDATYNNLDELSRNTVKMRYQGYHWRKICDKYNVSQAMYYAMVSDAQNFAIAAACEVGILKVI